jgi:ribosomal protein S18 acetylase RimI-like enzyme
VPVFRIRPATRADDLFFRQMELRTTWASLHPEDQRRMRKEDFREALTETHELLLKRSGTQLRVAETESGERAGLLWFGTNRNLITGEDEAWIYNVSVVPEYQGQGVGALLVQHAEELAREGGHRVLGLMVSEHNERAQRLYEKVQFQTTNRVMRKFLTPRDTDT